MTDNKIEYSKEASDLVIEAIDASVKLLAKDGVLWPFMLAGGKIIYFDGETTDVCVAQAKEAAVKIKNDIEVFAIAYDAILTLEGTKTPAIVVELTEKQKRFVLTQQYELIEEKQVQAIGEVRLLTEQVRFK